MNATYSPDERERLRQANRIAFGAILFAAVMTYATGFGLEIAVDAEYLRARQQDDIFETVFLLNGGAAAVVSAAAIFRLHPAPARRLVSAAAWLVLSPFVYSAMCAAYYGVCAVVGFAVRAVLPVWTG